MPIPFLAPIAAGLGSMFTGASVAAGGKALLGAVAGGAVNRFFDNRKQSDSYNFLASKGLTPQEIAGSGAAGQGSTNVGSVLGNQAAELERISRQQAYDEKQRNLDRAIAVRSQDMGLASAQVSASPGLGRNALDLERLRSIDAPRARQDLLTSSPEFRLRELQMQMGPDNVYAEGLLKRYGLSLNDDSIANASPETWARFVKDFQSFRSRAATEAAGATTVLGDSAAGYSAGADSAFRWNPLRRENWPIGSPAPVLGGPAQRF